jgi:hypothetical protein
MITTKILTEIETNINTGIEYEIALFRCLLKSSDEICQVDAAIKKRHDARKIETIINRTSISQIMGALASRSLTMIDVSFETQNDEVGPSDVVMVVDSSSGKREKIGLSIKYSNTCTLNATGRKFLTEFQIRDLQKQLPKYIDDYISEMTELYGSVNNWFRRRKFSVITDRYIDLIRDEVIQNWPRKSEDDRISILREAYQETSPIDSPTGFRAPVSATPNVSSSVRPAQPVEISDYTAQNRFPTYNDLQNAKNCDKPERKVKEIRVFYDDGTYEIFIPAMK